MISVLARGNPDYFIFYYYFTCSEKNNSINRKESTKESNVDK